MKLRVLIFSDSYLPKIDGIGISTDRFTRLLAKEGHEFVVVCPRYSKDDFEKVGKRIQIIRLPNRSLPSYPDVRLVLPKYRKLKKMIKEFKPHLIHFQTPGILGTVAGFLARKYKIPLVGTYHTMMNELGEYISPYRLLKLDRLVQKILQGTKLSKLSDHKVAHKKQKSLTNKLIYKITNSVYEQGKLIISPSILIKQELEKQKVKVPVVVVSNGMDLKKFSGKPRKLSKKPKLLHVGRIGFEKNADVLVRSFVEVKKKIPEATFSIVGDGPALASVKELAIALKIDSSIDFPGFIRPEQLPEVYENHDFFWTASAMETQGLVALEASACGLPSVGVDAYALPELIIHGNNGFIAPPFDHLKIARYAVSILTDAKLYKKFSANAIQVAARHDVKKSAKKLLKVYEKVIK